MTAPMTPERLAEIRKLPRPHETGVRMQCDDAIDELLAEVERLRVGLDIMERAHTTEVARADERFQKQVDAERRVAELEAALREAAEEREVAMNALNCAEAAMDPEQRADDHFKHCALVIVQDARSLLGAKP